MNGRCVAFLLAALAAGCCSSQQPWGQMEGFQDVVYVNNGQPLSIPTLAPRDDIYGLWQLSDKRVVGKCVHRQGSDNLIATVFLRQGERLGFCTSSCGLEAYAGDQCFPLSDPDYSWRLEITEQDKKQIAKDNFWYGVTDVFYGMKFLMEHMIFGLGL